MKEQIVVKNSLWYLSCLSIFHGILAFGFLFVFVQIEFLFILLYVLISLFLVFLLHFIRLLDRREKFVFSKKGLTYFDFYGVGHEILWEGIDHVRFAKKSLFARIIEFPRPHFSTLSFYIKGKKCYEKGAYFFIYLNAVSIREIGEALDVFFERDHSKEFRNTQFYYLKSGK